MFATTGAVQLLDDEGNRTTRDVNRRDSTAGTFSGFTGLRIAAGRRLFLRPEFEISRAGEHMRLGGTVAVGITW